MKNNFLLFLGFSVATTVAVGVIGDYMCGGWWYYFTLPLVAWLIRLGSKPSVPLVIGINVAIILTYVPYFYHNMTALHPEGLLGLGHLFSLPGLAIGVACTRGYRGARIQSKLATFFIGLSLSFGVFLINQLAVCHTEMYCGCFSL